MSAVEEEHSTNHFPPQVDAIIFYLQNSTIILTLNTGMKSKYMICAEQLIEQSDLI